MLNKQTKKAKKDYYYRIFDSDCLPISDVVWKKLNEVINRKTRATLLEEIVADGKILTGVELSDKFNKYFPVLGGNVEVNNTEILHSIRETENTIFLRPTDI